MNYGQSSSIISVSLQQLQDLDCHVPQQLCQWISIFLFLTLPNLLKWRLLKIWHLCFPHSVSSEVLSTPSTLCVQLPFPTSVSERLGCAQVHRAFTRLQIYSSLEKRSPTRCHTKKTQTPPHQLWWRHSMFVFAAEMYCGIPKHFSIWTVMEVWKSQDLPIDFRK